MIFQADTDEGIFTVVWFYMICSLSLNSVSVYYAVVFIIYPAVRNMKIRQNISSDDSSGLAGYLSLFSD